jgi:hypothetical protein
MRWYKFVDTLNETGNRYHKGIEVYEDIMNDTPDFDVGFNLTVYLPFFCVSSLPIADSLWIYFTLGP